MNNIKFYKNNNGKSEIEEYILELQNKKDKDSKIKLNKIIAYINLLAKYGTNMGNLYKVFKKWNMGIKTVERYDSFCTL